MKRCPRITNAWRTQPLEMGKDAAQFSLYRSKPFRRTSDRRLPPCLHGCEYNASCDQRDAGRVIGVEALAEEHHGKDRTEYGHQVPRLAGPRRADQLDAAVEEQVGDE